jgi:hypothetical protein
MADPTMADFLQGRTPAPYMPTISEFTTPGDLKRERIARAFGWDAGNPDPYAQWAEFARRAALTLPLALPAIKGASVKALFPEVPRPIRNTLSAAAAAETASPVATDEYHRLQWLWKK